MQDMHFALDARSVLVLHNTKDAVFAETLVIEPLMLFKPADDLPKPLLPSVGSIHQTVAAKSQEIALRSSRFGVSADQIVIEQDGHFADQYCTLPRRTVAAA